MNREAAIRVYIATIAGALTSPLVFGQATFERMYQANSVAERVSDDGRIVVGYSSDRSGGIIWVRGDGITTCTSTTGVACSIVDLSGDGQSFLVSENQGRASFVWSSEHGRQSLDPAMHAFAISADGETVVGRCGDDPCLQRLGSQLERIARPIQATSAVFRDCSGDGSTIVGTMNVPAGGPENLLRWTADGGLEILDGVMVNTNTARISANGNVILTGSLTPTGAAVVVVGDSVRELPRGSYDRAHPFGCSADGRLIVGEAVRYGRGQEAVIWYAGRGPITIAEIFDAFGLSADDWSFKYAFDVSADGRHIVGQGTNLSNSMEGWVFSLPPTLLDPVIVASYPENNIVDARQDRSANGQVPRGFDRVRITFPMRMMDASTGGPVDIGSFGIVDSNDDPPPIVDVFSIDAEQRVYTVVFQDPISPGVWTTLIANVETWFGYVLPADQRSIHIGFLPGDVDGNGVASALDIVALIDSLNGVNRQPIERTDMNRSGVANAADILRLVDLLNGANSTRPWLGATLPPRP